MPCCVITIIIINISISITTTTRCAIIDRCICILSEDGSAPDVCARISEALHLFPQPPFTVQVNPKP